MSKFNPIITTKLITTLNPCDDRFDNWKAHYEGFKGSAQKFLTLENITTSDKIWVLCRVLPRELAEVFAIDCAVSAAYAATVSTTYAAYAYTDAERENQLDALAYLIESFEKEELK